MAYVKKVSGSNHSANGNDASVTLDTTAVDFIIVAQSWLGSEPVFTDGTSNVYNQLTPKSNARSIRLIWSRPTFVGPGHVFSTSCSSCTPSLGVIGFSGSASSPFDAETGATPSGSSGQPGNINPFENNELIVSASGDTENTSRSVPGMQEEVDILTGTFNAGLGMGYVIQITAAAINPTWTFGSETFLALVQAAFKAGADSGNIILMGDGLT